MLGFPGGSVVKNLPANAEDTGSIPRWGRSPGEEKWQPTSLFLPGKLHGQRSPMGYSPWDGRVRHDCATKQHPRCITHSTCN